MCLKIMKQFDYIELLTYVLFRKHYFYIIVKASIKTVESILRLVIQCFTCISSKYDIWEKKW